VLIEPGDVFFTSPRNTGNFIRLGYQSIPAAQIAQGIKALAQAMQRM
jgi:GntR family transcriptional regulator/MocR family aminotransferase